MSACICWHLFICSHSLSVPLSCLTMLCCHAQPPSTPRQLLATESLHTDALHSTLMKSATILRIWLSGPVLSAIIWGVIRGMALIPPSSYISSI